MTTAIAPLIHATVKYESDRIFDTERGARRKLVFDIPGSDQPITIWGHADDPTFTTLKKKQAVQLLQTGTNQKGDPVFKIVLPDAAHTAPQLPPTEAPKPQPVEERWSAKHKQAIAEEVKHRVALMNYCRAQVVAEFPAMDAASVDRYAIALYRDVVKV
jgi:hypothetical protein